MKVYVVEAVPSDSPESVGRKWRHKHRHHPSIAGATTYYRYHECLTAKDFKKQLTAFVQQQGQIDGHGGERIVLWMSVHGAPTRKSVCFGRGKYLSFWSAMGGLHKKLLPNVVVIQSVCWGAYPGITRFMSKPTRGPCLTFGPTIGVAVAALHRAEKEVLKFLAQRDHETICPADVRALVRSINAYGAQSPHEGHEKFYRVWYFRRGALKRYPGPIGPRRVRRIVSDPS